MCNWNRWLLTSPIPVFEFSWVYFSTYFCCNWFISWNEHWIKRCIRVSFTCFTEAIGYVVILAGNFIWVRLFGVYCCLFCITLIFIAVGWEIWRIEWRRTRRTNGLFAVFWNCRRIAGASTATAWYTIITFLIVTFRFVIFTRTSYHKAVLN